MIYLRSLVGVALLVAGGTVHAQQDQPQAEALPQPAYLSAPGYVDFDLSKLLSAAEPAVIIQLEKPMIKMMAGAFMQEEPEMAKLLEGLELIRVQVSPVPAENREDAITSVDSTIKNLTAGGEWMTMMKVQENQEQIHVLTRAAGEKMNGLAAFILEPDGEAVFVNVVGEFSPEAIGALMSKAMSGHGPFGNFDSMDWDEMTKEHGSDDEADETLGNTIALDAGGAIRFNGEVVDEDALRNELRELANEDPKATINVRADDEVIIGRVMEIMEVVKGIEDQEFGISLPGSSD